MNRFVFLVVLVVSVCRTAAGPWPGVAFSEVRAFAWTPKFGAPNQNGVVHDDLSLMEGAINPEGAVLSKEQVRRVLKAQARRPQPSSISMTKGCIYDPHNAILFYDDHHRPVAALEICFNCLAYREKPEDPHSDLDKVEVAAVFVELGLPIGLRRSVAELREEEQQFRDLIKKLEAEVSDSAKPSSKDRKAPVKSN